MRNPRCSPRQSPFTLLARFDTKALCVDPPGQQSLPWRLPLRTQQALVFKSLRLWCHTRAGVAARPVLTPWALPLVEEAFAVAHLSGAQAAGKSLLALALSRELDGSVLLEACPTGWAHWHVRLRVKLHDCQWWRARQLGDPWDCGYVHSAALASGAIARFLPRRATLIVADGLTGDEVEQCAAQLHANRAWYRCPVRLLVIGSGGEPAPPDATHFELSGNAEQVPHGTRIPASGGLRR